LADPFLFVINSSIGFSTKTKSSEDIYDVIIEAETRLYRQKLFEKDSFSNSIILSLERTLWAKSSETEEHAERLKKLSIEIGKRLGLPSSQLDDLKLLSSLHDLGKVGISESILTKKTKLNDRDWERIKKHPETGYLIAKSSPQLAHIAVYILHHHEWWNGGGYPKGLSGEKIPLLSRIISVVDAFDVMVNGRIYKKPISVVKAVNELRKCKGTQFDPNIVELFIKILGENEFISA
jgi:HD-GYP domain-containing protein (c-di-GMP phosphodiesterase class II)